MEGGEAEVVGLDGKVERRSPLWAEHAALWRDERPDRSQLAHDCSSHG